MAQSEAGFRLAKDRGYMLDRSHAAACRLNLQYYLWQGALKYLVHPSIPTQGMKSIADVATGTAMWLIDMSKEFSSAELDGFDINLDQAPHQKWLPTNIKLRKWNILEDLPEDVVGRYDLVHVRLLVMALEAAQVTLVTRNLFRMLKPGGYLQWDELDCVHMEVKRVDPDLSAPALEQIKEMCYANGRYNWTVKLHESIAEDGFQDAKIEFFGDPPELVRALQEQHMLTMEEFAAQLMKIGKLDAANRFHELITQGYKESTAGAAFCIPRLVVTGRKPL